MASPGFLSKRVKKKSQTGLTTDRYEFLGLDQAEPDLGDPLVGLSSIGANPAPIGGSKYVLIAAGGNTGKRYWVDTSNLSNTGLIPGSFTVFNNNQQVGAANSFNKFNFVGSGVTVDPVSSDPSLQTGIATVRITVTDLVGPGNVNSIPYKASNGFLAGATDFVYSSGSIGIGTTVPTETLEVVGTMKVSGTITGTATTATTALGFSTTASINTTGIITASSFVGSLVGIASTATTALGFSTTSSINTSGIITASSFVGSLTGTATTATGLTATSNINTSGIITATTFYGSLVGNISTTGQSFETIGVTGLSTFTDGPVLVGSGIQTGTSKLQVSGNTFITGSVGIGTTNSEGIKLFVSQGSPAANRPIALITDDGTIPTMTSGATLRISNDDNQNTFSALEVESGIGKLVFTNAGNLGIGTTNPTSKLHVEGGGTFTGIVSATSFIGSGASLTGLIPNTVSSSSTTTPQYIGFLTANSGTTTSILASSTLTYIPSSGNLGIGTTNPRTPLQVEIYGVKTGVGTFTASVGVSTTLDSFSVSSTDFKTAEYTVHIGFGSYIQAQKVLVMQDQTTAYSEEYAVMYNNSLLVSIGATIGGGNCILQATPQTGVSGLTTYRFARNTLL